MQQASITQPAHNLDNCKEPINIMVSSTNSISDIWPSIISTIYHQQEQYNLRIPTFKTIISYLLIIFFVHIINIVYHVHRKYDKKYPPMAPGGMFNHIFRATKANYAWWLLVRIMLCIYVMCVYCKRLWLLEWGVICLIQTNTFLSFSISTSS